MDKNMTQETREDICVIWRHCVSERQKTERRKDTDTMNLYSGLMGKCQKILHTVNQLSNELERLTIRKEGSV